MRRRRLLSGAGLAFATPFTGCLGSESGAERDCDPPEYPDYDGDYPRVDEPPHDVPVVDESDQLDPNDLGACMETESALEYTVHPPHVKRRIQFLYNTTYRATLVTDEAERDEYLDFDGMGDDLRERLTAIDFGETLLVVVESGWKFGPHRWARIETVDGGIHLHGYHELPTDTHLDVGGVSSLLEVERPDDVEFARVSLTGHNHERARRVNFDSTEGVVKLAGGSVPEAYTIEAIPIDDEIPPSDNQCQFGDLEAAVKPEIESAIENGEYHTSDRLAFFKSDCYGKLVRYEGDIYRPVVKAL